MALDQDLGGGFRYRLVFSTTVVVSDQGTTPIDKEVCAAMATMMSGAHASHEFRILVPSAILSRICQLGLPI